MNFKEALIAHLQGERVEVNYKNQGWSCFSKEFSAIPLDALKPFYDASGYEFRIAQRTITVNGVEVPAPEKVAPNGGGGYFYADPAAKDLATKATWTNHRLDEEWLERGLVYLNKEDAIARAKAMLISS